jgi:hypothetical protein
MATKAAPKATAAPAPKAEAIKPEKLPVDLGGGTIEFVKRSDYAKRTADNFRIKFKSEIKQDHVTQALGAIDGGQRELTGENPEEFVKLFATVLEDYEAGVDEVKRLNKEAADKKAADEAKAKEKAESENALYLDVKDTKSDFSTLAKNFDTGNMDRFIPNEDATAEDLFAALNSSFSMAEFTSFMQGDLVCALQDRGLENVVSKIAEAKNIGKSGLYNKAKTCRAIPPEKRNGVSYTILSEIATAKFSKEQEPKKLELLDRALSGKVNTTEARAEVRKIQGKVEPEKKAPEEDEDFDFLVIDLQTDDINLGVQTTTGFPKERYEAGALVINPKTMKVFAKNGFKKSEEKRWEDLPVYTKPVEAAKPAKKKK